MQEDSTKFLRVAIYARVSTEEQREGQTIDSQISELDGFARSKGWPVTGVYKDDGWSGAAMERPELDRLRDDAAKKLFDAVLINDVDRLARDVAHLGVIKRDFEKRGVKVLFRKLPAETSPTYNLMVNILGSFAEFEREMIADRTRRGRRHKVETRKQYFGSNTSYGYHYLRKDRIAGTDGVLKIAPDEAAVVRQIFEWVDEEGLSARRVLHRLNERRIPPRKGAPRWAKSSVLRLLHCETYSGVWNYNKYQSCEPEDPARVVRYRKRIKSCLRLRSKTEWIRLELPKDLRIVPRDRWERVQQRLAQNAVFSPRNEKHSYLLKGLIRCGACNATYAGDPCHGEFYYRCINRCKGFPLVREEKLNEAVKSAVTKIMTDPDVILEPLVKLDKARREERDDVKDQKAEIESESKRLAVEESRLLEAYRRGIITPVQLGQQLDALKSRTAVLEMSRAELIAAEREPVEEVKSAISDYCATAAANLAQFSREQWQQLLRAVVRSIIFKGDCVVIRGRIPVASSASGGFELMRKV